MIIFKIFETFAIYNLVFLHPIKINNQGYIQSTVYCSPFTLSVNECSSVENKLSIKK